MISFNIFEGLVCNWKFPACCTGGGANTSNNRDVLYDDDDDDDANQAPPPPSALRRVTEKHGITILPIPTAPTTELDTNLYPLSNQVDKWNIFVVGSDKTYILANVNDPIATIPLKDSLPNRKADNIIPPEMQEFFDAVWDKTLEGEKLQMYVAWNERLFHVNTYPLINQLSNIVGATMFMRAFKHTIYDSGIITLSKMQKHAASTSMKTK